MTSVPQPAVPPSEVLADPAFVSARSAVEVDPVAASIARRAVEDALIELRNIRCSVVPQPGNGLVIRERDSPETSTVIRLTTYDALVIGIRTYLTAVGRLGGPGHGSALEEIAAARADLADDLPNGTSRHNFRRVAADAELSQAKAARGPGLTWLHIVRTDFWMAMSQTDNGKLRAALVRLAATVVAWIECIDRRES